MVVVSINRHHNYKLWDIFAVMLGVVMIIIKNIAFVFIYSKFTKFKIIRWQYVYYVYIYSRVYYDNNPKIILLILIGLDF